LGSRPMAGAGAAALRLPLPTMTSEDLDGLDRWSRQVGAGRTRSLVN